MKLHLLEQTRFLIISGTLKALFPVLLFLILFFPVNTDAAAPSYNMYVKFSANGGVLKTDTSADRQYRLNGNRVQISGDHGKTWKNVSIKISPNDKYKNLINASTFGLTKKGYHTVSTKEYNTATDGSGINVSRCNTASNKTNPATVSAINGGRLLTANKTVILFVNWIPNTYTVHYDPNGGTGSMSDQIFTYGKKQTSRKNRFTRDGYIFTGWTTAKDGSSTLYPDEKAFTKLSSVNGKTVTLYANWEKKSALSVSCEDPSVQFTVTVNEEIFYTGSGPFTSDLHKGDVWEITDIRSDDPHVTPDAGPLSGTAEDEDISVIIDYTLTPCDTDGPVQVITPATDDTEGEGLNTCSICGKESGRIVFPAHNTYDSSVVFSAEAGIYRESVMDVSVSSPSGLPVYYTTDGSVPDDSAFLSNGSIYITAADTNTAFLNSLQQELIGGKTIKYDPLLPTATVVRASVKYPDGTFGPAVTKTYIMNNDISNFNCAVVSLTADPADLLDYNAGIMAKGAIFDENIEYNNEMIRSGALWEVIANYTMKGWKCPAHFELFDSTNTLSCEADCRISLKGGVSRTFAQKSFNIGFRPKYGADSLDYPVFADAYPGYGANDISNYNDLSLRAGGNVTEFMKFRDMMFNEMASDNAFFGVQTGKPAIAFLNGEYYGAFALNEKYSARTLAAHSGVEEDNIIIYKENSLEDGLETDEVYYQELMSYAEQDMTDPDVWERFQTVVDINSMADYYATEIYIGNADWNETKNIQLWRAREDDGSFLGDGRWRFLMYDTEYSAGLYDLETTQPSYNHLQAALDSFPLFASAMRNPEFAALFGEMLYKAADTYSPENVNSTLENYVAVWTPWVLEGYRRFNDASWSVTQDPAWIRSFFSVRAEYILRYYENYAASIG